jgi:hypothetical protein
LRLERSGICISRATRFARGRCKGFSRRRAFPVRSAANLTFSELTTLYCHLSDQVQALPFSRAKKILEYEIVDLGLKSLQNREERIKNMLTSSGTKRNIDSTPLLAINLERSLDKPLTRSHVNAFADRIPYLLSRTRNVRVWLFTNPRI